MEGELSHFSSCHVLLMMLEIMQIKLMSTADSQPEGKGFTFKYPWWIQAFRTQRREDRGLWFCISFPTGRQGEGGDV
jgi:hypothetical protein